MPFQDASASPQTDDSLPGGQGHAGSAGAGLLFFNLEGIRSLTLLNVLCSDKQKTVLRPGFPGAGSVTRAAVFWVTVQFGLESHKLLSIPIVIVY